MNKDFEYFKDNGGGNALRMAGLDISQLKSFAALRKAADSDSDIVEILRKGYGTASGAERCIIAATLCACGFAQAADELSKGRTFQNMQNMGESFKKCYLIALGSN